MPSSDTATAPAPGANAPAPGTPPPVVAFEKVERRYGAFRPALLDVELAVVRGQCLVVHGAAGAGKSVLLRLAAGLEDPTGGVVRIAGEAIGRLGPRPRALLRRSMGILPPGDLLLDARTALENVALAAWVAGVARDEGLRRASAALQTLGVGSGQADGPAGSLSGSQRRCVALARALVNRPALLLLDDPFGGLDEAAGLRAGQMLAQFSASGVTIMAAAGAAGATLQAWPAAAHHVRLVDGKVQQ